MTEEEKIICKQFLNDADKTHSCNEYKLLMALLDQEPRKGEWQLTDDEMFVYCPFCNQTDYTRPIDASWKYCPECGARLD